MIFDVIVVGGGVIGTAIFNKLVRIGKRVALLDKASDVATGQSKANSALVHAGYDPAPNTLKAKMNVKGNALFPALCRRLGVPFKRTGALVVGDDRAMIERLYARGKENGVKNLFILNREQILSLAPDIAGGITVALYAKSAGITSPYLLTIALADEGILNGGKVFLEEDIKKVVREGEVFKITTLKGEFFTRNIVNSAGAGYNDISKILKSESYPLTFRRGEYFVFDKNANFKTSCTLFPLPTKMGKGVLVTPTVDGNFLVGPTSEDSDERTITTDAGLNDIKEKAKNILKNINFKNAIRQFSGVRVISGEDFIIERSRRQNGVINLAGICSPGLSSAPAIAEYVVELLGYKNEEKKNLKALPKHTLFKNLPITKQRELLRKDKSFGEIVCKCEKITKGDILSALNRPLKVHSVDGIKRRTNAGMGICQGGFCFTKVVKMIAKARKIKYEEVLKENRGSEVALGDIREVEKW